MSAYTLRCWRESASLILVGKAVAAATTTSSSKTPVIPSQHGNKNNNANTSDFNILMLKRSSKMTFFPNFYAFPGGSADEADFSADWLDILSPSFNLPSSPYSPRESLFRLFSQETKDNRRAPIFSRKRDPKYSVLPSDIAFRICAIRETFEETGILLARKAGPDPELSLELSNSNVSNGDFSQVARRRCAAKIYDMPTEQLNEWRQCVLKKADNFIKMCQELDLVPDLTALSEWSNWLTPTTTKSGKRFDTVFFISFVDHLPNVTLEENESSCHMWQTPKDYFSQVFTGSINLGPPQVYELNYMNFPSWEAFHDDVECHPHYHAPQWMAVRTKCKDGLLFVFPGDDKYPKNVDREVPTDPVELPLTKQEFGDTNRSSHFYDPDKLELRRNYPFSSFRAQPLKESIMSLIQSKL